MDKLVYKDEAGNTLWTKDRAFLTMYGRNAEGQVLTDEDFRWLFGLAKRSGRIPADVKVSEFVTERHPEMEEARVNLEKIHRRGAGFSEARL